MLFFFTELGSLRGRKAFYGDESFADFSVLEAETPCLSLLLGFAPAGIDEDLNYCLSSTLCFLILPMRSFIEDQSSVRIWSLAITLVFL